MRTLVIATALAVPASTGFAQQRSAPQVSYRSPARNYTVIKAGQRQFFVESALATGDRSLTQQSLKRLNANIDKAMAFFPESHQRILEAIPFYVMYGSQSPAGGRDKGMVYFQRQAPQHREWVDKKWGSSIVVYSASNYVKLTDFWALKAVLHELAHAYQLEQWQEKQPDIVAAYDNAISKGLYHGVMDDRGKTVAKAYAATNQLEYFAELSCMYFVGCNYFPNNRAKLRSYDPEGIAMIQKMWNPGTAPPEDKSPMRMWKANSAGTMLAARFASADKDTVTLTRQSGKTQQVEIRLLSDLDQVYIDNKAAGTVASGTRAESN